MKTTFSYLVIAILALSVISCEKTVNIDNPDALPEAKITVMKSDSGKTSTEKLTDCHLSIEREGQGKSHLSSMISVDGNVFFLGISFDNINSLTVGKKIEPLSVTLYSASSFSSSSYTSAGLDMTSDFSGSIWLVDRNNTEAVLQFKKLCCTLDYGKFVIDGSLRCQLE